MTCPHCGGGLAVDARLLELLKREAWTVRDLMHETGLAESTVQNGLSRIGRVVSLTKRPEPNCGRGRPVLWYQVAP